MLKPLLKQNKTIFFTCLVLLSACASSPQENPSTRNVSNKPVISNNLNNLQHMNAGFLYLAAQDAINNGQGALAIAFLNALVTKDPSVAKPRLQLAELLLRAKQPNKSLAQLNIIIADKPASSVSSPQQAHPYLLQAKALVLSGEKQQAHAILADLLSTQPALLSARLFQIRLWIGANHLKNAHTSIREGLAQKKNVKLLNIQAELYTLQGQLKKADAALREIAKLDPDNERIIIARMQMAMKRGHTLRAEKILRNFLKTHPKSMRIRNALGRHLIQSKRSKEAIQIYQDLVRDTGGNIEVLSALGLLYYQLRDFEKAASTFRKAVDVAPNNISHFYLATSLEALNKIDEARLIFEKIDASASTYIEAQLRIISMDIRSNNLTSAEKRLFTILKKQPDLIDAHSMLANIRIAQEKYQLLLDETDRLLSLPLLNTSLLFNRAVAFEHFKRFDNVETTLIQLLEIDGGHVDALNFLGYIYADQGIKLKQAEKLIRKALAQRPSDGYILDSLAWVYFKRGDYAKAIKQQKKALKQTADDAVIHEHLGDMLWRNKQNKAAIAAWNKSLEFKHEHPDKIRLKIEKGLP